MWRVWHTGSTNAPTHDGGREIIPLHHLHAKNLAEASCYEREVRPDSIERRLDRRLNPRRCLSPDVLWILCS